MAKVIPCSYIVSKNGTPVIPSMLRRVFFLISIFFLIINRIYICKHMSDCSFSPSALLSLFFRLPIFCPYIMYRVPQHQLILLYITYALTKYDKAPKSTQISKNYTSYSRKCPMPFTTSRTTCKSLEITGKATKDSPKAKP